MSLFLMILNLINSNFLLASFHPLSMSLIILIQTFLLCIFISTNLKNFWFSYILILIFLGGLLILFIYISSLASNEMFSFSKYSLICMIFMILLSFFILMILDKLLNQFNNFNLDTYMINNMKSFNFENLLILNKLFNFPMNSFSIILMIYLLLTLMITVKICNLFEGPLRPS